MNCPRCADTGECVVDETPTSIGLKPEYGPCDCAAGLALIAMRQSNPSVPSLTRREEAL